MAYLATIALPFCGFRDYIALAHTTSCVRALPEVARTLRVFREAIDGAPLEYLRDIYLLCYARAENTDTNSVTKRMMAHALMHQIPILADWAESVSLDAYMLTNHNIGILKNRVALALGDLTKLGSTVDAINIADICHLIVVGLGREEHFAWIDDKCRDLDSDITTFTTINIRDNMMACRTNKRACGEWIECWIARDTRRAREIFPFSKAITCAIFSRAVLCNPSRFGTKYISAEIGPRLAQLLLKDNKHEQVIMQFAHDSPEMEQCFARLRESCAQLQVYMDETIKTQPLRYCSPIAKRNIQFISHALSTAAMNPDALVFARALDIVRASECVPEICEFEWTYRNEFAVMKRAVNRLESANIRVSFSGVRFPSGIAQIITHMSRDDAPACADFMLSRMVPKTYHNYAVNKAHARSFLQACVMFGKPLTRIVRAYFGRMNLII